jgi:hypothetical protein
MSAGPTTELDGSSPSDEEAVEDDEPEVEEPVDDEAPPELVELEPLAPEAPVVAGSLEAESVELEEVP